MHGLINLAIELYVRETHGPAFWANVVRDARLPFDRFEAMMTYDPAMTDAVITAVGKLLGRPLDAVMEDMGTFLVSHRANERLRRLLRFGGSSFVDFLHSLEELPDRARLALPDLVLPQLELEECGTGDFRLSTQPFFLGSGFVLVGLLRAMADDYGSLAFLELQDGGGAGDEISITLLDAAHAEGRGFDLAAGVR